MLIWQQVADAKDSTGAVFMQISVIIQNSGRSLSSQFMDVPDRLSYSQYDGEIAQCSICAIAMPPRMLAYHDVIK